MPINVLIADDYKLLRDGLRACFAGESGIHIIGEAVNGLQAVERALSLAPDIVIMDISMKGLSGIEATRRIKEQRSGIKIIGLSMRPKKNIIRDMLQAGACKTAP